MLCYVLSLAVWYRSSHDDAAVRVKLLGLLTSSPSDCRHRQQLVRDVLAELVSCHSEMLRHRGRCYASSMQHRRSHRIMTAILLLDNSNCVRLCVCPLVYHVTVRLNYLEWPTAQRCLTTIHDVQNCWNGKQLGKKWTGKRVYSVMRSCLWLVKRSMVSSTIWLVSFVYTFVAMALLTSLSWFLASSSRWCLDRLAPKLIGSPRSIALRRFLKTVCTGAELTSGERLFLSWLPGTGNARSPTVETMYVGPQAAEILSTRDGDDWNWRHTECSHCYITLH